ncbi:type IVB secretion system protein IcmH/DotU [Niveibacterium umoris]
MMSQVQAPSLFGDIEPRRRPPAEAPRQAKTLADMMYDGFYLMFLIRNRNAPVDAESFRNRLREFLDDFERNAKRANIPADDIFAAKYAFCAAMDEHILSSRFSIRDAWERQPLQLAFFGDQLAGERFFERLEGLRAEGAARLQSLEVYHLCLLLGFRGKYLLESPEKLGYLVGRLGDEIAHYKGNRAAFAPDWAAPDAVKHALRSNVPLWGVLSAYALVALGLFVGLQTWLGKDTDKVLAAFHDIVKVAPRQAHVTISLP